MCRRIGKIASKKFTIFNLKITDFLYFIEVLIIDKNVQKKLGKLPQKKPLSHLNSSQNFTIARILYHAKGDIHYTLHQSLKTFTVEPA